MQFHSIDGKHPPNVAIHIALIAATGPSGMDAKLASTLTAVPVIRPGNSFNQRFPYERTNPIDRHVRFYPLGVHVMRKTCAVMNPQGGKSMPGKVGLSKTCIAIAMVFTMVVGRCVFAQPPTITPQYGPIVMESDPPHPAVGSLPRRITPETIENLPDPLTNPDGPPIEWWSNRVTQQVLDRSRWVSFDLETVLLDTLANSPRIQSVAYQTSATFQRIIEQDAAFDPTVLLGGDLGATNDPVGNTLTTGGAERLREKSMNVRGGAKRTTRRGTELEWSQQLGFLDSNSSFFIPRDQGNARLSLGLTKPLLSRGGRYYNERLVTQARIENRVAWQDMRGEVEQRIADVITAYWRLYELRAQLTQQRELLSRSRHIEQLLISRRNFDAARIEIIKAAQRVARRADQVIDLEAELKKQQSRLSALIGSDALIGVESDLELIPTVAPKIHESHWNLRDAVAQALEYRPEVRSATHEVELSALELKVTRVELEPQLNWIFNGYLSQLNGASQVARSFGEQFANAPGVSTGLEFELPRGRRAVRAQHREAFLRARQRNERLREVIQQTQFDVETALIDLDRLRKQQISKRNVLSTAIVEENILTVQWRLVGGDDSRVGIKLENLLDAQQRRTDAEKDLVAAESDYMIALVTLQRAMGTLLINEGILPHQSQCTGDIDFVRELPSGGPADQPTAEEIPAPVRDVEADVEIQIEPSNTLTDHDSLPVENLNGSMQLDGPMPSWLEHPNDPTIGRGDGSIQPPALPELKIQEPNALLPKPPKSLASPVEPISGSRNSRYRSDSRSTVVPISSGPTSALQMPSYSTPSQQTAPRARAAWASPSGGWN